MTMMVRGADGRLYAVADLVRIASVESASADAMPVAASAAGTEDHISGAYHVNPS